MALTGMAIASALALAKNEMIDKPAAERKRKLAAATAAYSPWTGMKPQDVQDPNALGQVLQYGGAGAAIGSAVHADSAKAGLDTALAGNPAVSGSALGGSEMSAKLGDQASKFNEAQAAAGTPGADESNAWFYGGGPKKFSQPTLGSQYSQNDPYKSLWDMNANPNPPNSAWIKNKTDPFSNGY